MRDNRFWLVDRKKELIKVNGLQVAPAELEGVLLQHEHVADAGVVGVRIDGGKWPRAYLQRGKHSTKMISEPQIQDYMKTRVAKHKWLVGGIQFVDEIPRFDNGKIRRSALRAWSERDSSHLEARL